MTRKNLRAGARVHLKEGARYLDKTLIPARFLCGECTVLSAEKRAVLLAPMMRYVPYRDLSD